MDRGTPISAGGFLVMWQGETWPDHPPTRWRGEYWVIWEMVGEYGWCGRMARWA